MEYYSNYVISYQCIPILDYSFQIIFHGVMIIYIKIDGGCLRGETRDQENQGYDVELLRDQ